MDLPKSEIVWERIYDDNERLTHVVTSDKRRERYSLYRVDRTGYTMVGRAKDPIELKRKFKY